VPAVLALTLVIAAPAHAYLYWGSHTKAIARSTNNGSRTKLSFIRGSGSAGIAVNAHYIYWTHNQEIGRANLDGSGKRPRFIRDEGLSDSPLAIDDAHLYWVSGGNSIARANLDGTDVEPRFINFQPHLTRPPTQRQIRNGLIAAVAVDATHLYWSLPYLNSIGRTNKFDQSDRHSGFLRTPCPGVLAVDATHIYWARGATNPRFNRGCFEQSIRRANVGGGGIRTLVKGVAAHGIAIDRRYLYATDPPALGIDRMTLDGKSFKHLFHTRGGGSEGIAVDGLGPGGFPASPAFASFCGCSGI
jgi:hypothetical protein